MKKSIFLLYFFLISNLLVSQTTENQKGIKQISEAIYTPKDRVKDRNIALQNHITEVTYYDPSGEITQIHNYEFDGSLWSVVKITLNENGIPTKGTTTDANENILEFYENKLNEKGEIIEQNTYDSNNQLISTQKSKFDSKGNEIEIFYENFKYKYTNSETHQFDLDNRVIKSVFTKSKGTMIKTEIRTYQYDDLGNCILETYQKEDGSILLIYTTYDQHNNWLTDKWVENNKVTNSTKFTYVYDQNNNWITRKRYTNGKLEMIWERNIVYY
ncbi:MAG: hypothetical protein C4K58_06430 [Flavobacteriaceae bacterium]|nr:MAG: hypothetical protein C4K58_06430 [Flavobacteriaceae bacterium]